MTEKLLKASLNPSTTNKWAGIQHKVQSGMCIQRIFKSDCASAQSDQSLSFPLEETLDPLLPINAHRRHWSGWADAQADLSLRWALVPIFTFCWTQTYMFFFSTLQGRMLHILPGKEKKDPTDEILGINSAPLEIFHTFLSSADFFQNHLFRKILSGIPSEWTYSAFNSLPPGKFFTLFCGLLIFSKSTFLKNSFRNTFCVSDRLDPDHETSGC